MAQIKSNFFKVEEAANSIKDKDFVNIPEKTIEEIPYINAGNELQKGVASILHSCKGYEGITFEEINISYKNFQDHHYEIMKHKHLIVIYDNANEVYKYLTPSGKVFITSDIKVIRIIHTVPAPYKITLTYVPLIGDEIIISLSLLSMVLYNIYTEEPSSLLKEYLKPTVTMDCSNEYSILYYLFNIYPRLEFEITKHKYWKYIYLEQYIYNVSKRELPIESINEEFINTFKENSKSDLYNILKDMNIDKESIKSNETLLESINTKTEYYPTLNKELADLMECESIYNLIKTMDTIKLLNYIEQYKKLPPISTVSSNGNIGTGIELSFIFSDKILIRGSYPDLYFKLLADVTHKKEYINLCSEDNSLIHELLDGVLDDDMLALQSYFIENYIKAITLGYKNDSDVLMYLEKSLNTLLSLTDLEDIKDTYENELSGLKKVIDTFNEVTYKNTYPKLLYHCNLEPIGIAIIDKMRLMYKSLIKEMDLYCEAFNKRNKAKIDIVYFDEKYLYILADEEAANTAFDTLTRIMPTIFTKVCPRIAPTCYVEIIN